MARRDRPVGTKPPDATTPAAATSGNSLLGDLESIRTLLDEGGRAAAPREAREQKGGAREQKGEAREQKGGAREEASDVPMLDDVVEGALRIEEQALRTRRSFADDASGPSALADDAIEALMGDEWRASADRIIRSAREAMMGAARRLDADDARSLDQQLRSRIDATLNDWMAEITLNHIDDLRDRILDAIGHEVRRITDALRADDDDDADEDER